MALCRNPFKKSFTLKNLSNQSIVCRNSLCPCAAAVAKSCAPVCHRFFHSLWLYGYRMSPPCQQPSQLLNL